MDIRERQVMGWRSFGIKVWSLIGLLLLLIAAAWVLGRIAGALTPVLLAVVIVLLLRGPVAWFEGRGAPRPLAVVLCYLIVVVGLTVAGLFIIPPLEAQIARFLADFPTYYTGAYDFWLGVQTRFLREGLPAWLGQLGESMRDTVTRQAAAWSSAVASGVIAAGGNVLGFVFNVLLALVLAFWLLKDYPSIREELLLLWRRPEAREEADVIFSNVSKVLSGYLKGQIIVSALTGTIIIVGLALLGVPYALVIGVIAGVLNVVPYLGPVVGGLLAAISALFVDPVLAIWAVLVVVAAQQVTDTFVTPRVMSEQVDLHPVLVIFSLLVGGTLFGFVGLLLAIPVAAVAKGLFVYYFEKHTDTVLGTEDGVLFRKTRSEDEGCEGATEAREGTDDAAD